MTGLVFLPLGIVLKQESDAIVEYAVQYDGAGKSLTISLVIPYMNTSILVLTLVEIGGWLSIIYGCARNCVMLLPSAYTSCFSHPMYPGTPDTYTSCKLADSSSTATCSITFKVEEKMKAPVYLYYELDNFYQVRTAFSCRDTSRQPRMEAGREADIIFSRCFVVGQSRLAPVSLHCICDVPRLSAEPPSLCEVPLGRAIDGLIA